MFLRDSNRPRVSVVLIQCTLLSCYLEKVVGGACLCWFPSGGGIERTSEPPKATLIFERTWLLARAKEKGNAQRNITGYAPSASLERIIKRVHVDMGSYPGKIYEEDLTVMSVFEHLRWFSAREM